MSEYAPISIARIAPFADKVAKWWLGGETKRRIWADEATPGAKLATGNGGEPTKGHQMRLPKPMTGSLVKDATGRRCKQRGCPWLIRTPARSEGGLIIVAPGARTT